MQKIYRDPLYRYSKQLSFEIPESVINELDCEDYLESDNKGGTEKASVLSCFAETKERRRDK